ncbi:AsmA family protein [Pelovirga terrestris]|uniref:AsmA family protein n=1 Tax=Pelovirga terrestris TaxID=2771352 RepID=A0A8J6QK22_9BACT|nr:AsmA family protein [Pelovirga terrestris]MBD1399574.1 AsmA family protein [Pelovirga terrestris]
MSGMVRFFLIVVAIISILLAALAVLIQTQLTPERVRTTFLPMVEKQFGRTVAIGDIDIGIFSGVTVADLSIEEADSSDLFVVVKTARLTYRLWSLLKGQLDISEIFLDGPEITIIRYPDGRFNFSTLLSENRQQTQTGPDQGSDAHNPQESLFELLIQRITMRNGQILFIDRFINPTAPFRYSFSNLNLSAKDISFSGSFPLDISMVLNQSQVHLSAQVDLSRQSGNAALRVTPLDLVPFAPYYRNQLPGPLGSAQLEVNLDLDWTPERLLSRGKVILNQVDMVLRDLPDLPLRGVRIATDYSIRYDIPRQLLDISTALLNYNDIKTSLQGNIDLTGAGPQFDLQVVLDKADLRHSIQSLPHNLTRQLQPYSPAGELTVHLRLLGPLSAADRLVHSARISLNQVQATVGHLRTGLNGDIAFAQNRLTSDNLLLKGGDQQAQLVFNLTNIMTPPIKGTFALSSRELNLNRLLPAEQEHSQPSASPGPPPLPAQEPGPFDLPFDVSGTATVDRLLYRQLTMSQVDAALSLKDNRLTLSPLRGRIGEGQFTLDSSVDLGVAGFSYEGQAEVAQPDLATLMSGIFPAASQKASGRVNWVNSFSGRGTMTDNLLKALQLEGEIQLFQGTISGFALLDQVSWFLDSPDLKNLSFRDVKGSYRLKDGKALIDSHFDGNQVTMTPKGSIGVDGTVNLSLATRLAPDILRRMGASERLKQAFVDSSGWGVLPLEIGGSLTSPQVRFDTGALEQQALDQVRSEASDRLLEKLLPEVEGESRESMKKLLDNTLKRLRPQ